MTIAPFLYMTVVGTLWIAAGHALIHASLKA